MFLREDSAGRGPAGSGISAGTTLAFAGKSTLLNAVAGTFFVDEGSIRLAGRDVTRWPEHARAELIGRVFQNPFSGTSPSLTIQDNLSLAALRGRSRGLG
jgi:putative tryptophan/tyrosine transport system ATP-binding protein